MDGIIEASPPANGPHAEPGTSVSLEQLTGCHTRERAVLLTHLERERQSTEAEIIHGLNRDVSVSLAGVVDGRRSRADRTHAERFVIPMYGSSCETIDLDRIAAEAGPAERPVLALLPLGAAFVEQICTVGLSADVSNVIRN